MVQAGNAPLRSTTWAAILIVGAVLLAYANSIHVPFVFDDELAIVTNPSLHRLATAWSPPEQLSGLPVSGRPLVNFGFALNYAISGDAVWSYHLFNIGIQAVCGLLIFGIVRRTLRQPSLEKRFGPAASGIALTSALLWSVHPLTTESVTYISQRAEALVAMFYLLVVYAFVRGAEPDSREGADHRHALWMGTGVIACLLGMLTKEVMVSAPLAVALYARTFLAGSWREAWARHRRVFVGLSATWLLLGWVVWHEHGARGASAGFGLGVTAWSYLLTQAEAIVMYLKLSLWPHPLVLDYGTGIVTSLAAVWWQALLLVLLGGATIWSVGRSRAIGWVGACFFMILAPSSSIIPLVGQTMAEHRMYLPLAFIISMAVVGVHSLLGRRAGLLIVPMLIAATALTARRNEDYASAIRICTDTVAKQPDNARAMALLADYDQRAGRLDDARRALEQSLKIQPGVVPVLNNLGDVLQRLGQPARAVECFRAALERRPNDAMLRNNLANALIASGQSAEGIAVLEAAVRTTPDSALLRSNLANALAASGQFSRAAEHFAALVRLQPDDLSSRRAYGEVLLALGRPADAIAQLTAAVRLAPNDGELHVRLGTVLGRTGHLREALAEFETAIRINPDDAVAQQNAAIARRRLGIR